MRVTNFGRFFALLLLYDKPRHGYEVLKVVGAGLGRRESAGQVYPFLGALQKRRYVVVSKTGGRGKKVFALTPSGRKFVKSLLGRFDALIEAAVEPHLRACSHCKCVLFNGGVERAVAGRKLFFCCSNCASAYRR